MARKSTEKYPGQRIREKREFWGRYYFRVIEYLYKERFFSLFDHRCFRCGAPDPPKDGMLYYSMVLCIDHHIPMALGGHLVAGNLVALCRSCNGLKLDKHPAAFYTPEELIRLQPLLDAQPALFAFAFDGDKWADDREAYLLEVGVAPAIVHASLHDEFFAGYINSIEDRPAGITLEFDIQELESHLGKVQNNGPP